MKRLWCWSRHWAPWLGVGIIALFMLSSSITVAVRQQEAYQRSSFEVYLAEARAAQQAEEPQQDEDTQQTQPPAQNTLTIYATPSGKRYHLDRSCAGENGQVITWDEADERGLTPCKRCAEG